LIDVGITVFESQELTEKEEEKQGTNPDIRKAERHFQPYHLKNTLQQSSHWGAVRVLPTEAEGVDVVVRGEIVESNGEHLVLDVDVTDAEGQTWFNKTYEAKATKSSYSGNVPGKKDAFQDLYNTVANDMVVYKEKMSPIEIRKIRTTAKLKFAIDFAPDAFGDYLSKDEEGDIVINRLPSDDDPSIERLERIRERDRMYVDTLNEYYEGFYNEMWPAYESWRSANLTEQTALRQVKKASLYRKVGGALLIALAIALDMSDVQNTGTLRNVMILAGGAVIVDGVNVSKQAKIHSAALQELSESFGSEMMPVVIEFQDEQYELSGSVEEQYARWRELLRQIYYAETGFGPPDEGPVDSAAGE
jgi:hypothetical protein